MVGVVIVVVGGVDIVVVFGGDVIIVVAAFIVGVDYRTMTSMEQSRTCKAKRLSNLQHGTYLDLIISPISQIFH